MLSSNFITAGKAIFTVSNGKGEHYTYKITKKEAQGNYPAAHFVSLLTGPDNTSDYTYIGMLDVLTGMVRTTAKSRLQRDSKPVRVINWTLGLVWSGADLPEGYNLQHEGRCGRCGRALTVPESIASGLGPECAGKIG